MEKSYFVLMTFAHIRIVKIIVKEKLEVHHCEFVSFYFLDTLLHKGIRSGDGVIKSSKYPKIIQFHKRKNY